MLFLKPMLDGGSTDGLKASLSEMPEPCCGEGNCRTRQSTAGVPRPQRPFPFLLQRSQEEEGRMGEHLFDVPARSLSRTAVLGRGDRFRGTTCDRRTFGRPVRPAPLLPTRRGRAGRLGAPLHSSPCAKLLVLSFGLVSAPRSACGSRTGRALVQTPAPGSCAGPSAGSRFPGRLVDSVGSRARARFGP